jgi:hypothetical protein
LKTKFIITMKKILFLLAASAMVSCNANQKSSGGTDSSKTDTTKTTVTTSTTEKKADVDPSSWSYETDTDKMTSKLSYFAAINATNKLQFGAPYEGGSTATVTIRSKAKKNEIILTIDKGQFICDVSDGCAIKVRFDNDPAVSFNGSEPSDYSSTTLFIHPEPKFIAHAKTAKKMIVEAEFYQEGMQDMEFNVAGLKWEH